MNILVELIKNQLIRFPFVYKRVRGGHSTGMNCNQERIAKAVAFYTSHADITGKHILEIGPGQTFQVAAQLRKSAASVTLLDVVPYLNRAELAAIGLDYRIYNGKHFPLADASQEIVFSYMVYEHIRYPEITVAETFRVLKPGGVVVHLIDLGDHFSYGVDANKLFHCLRYPRWLWNAMTWNRSSFVNRLRQSEWEHLHLKTGFTLRHKITGEAAHIKALYEAGKLNYLHTIAPEDRYCSSVVLVCQKPQ